MKKIEHNGRIFLWESRSAGKGLWFVPAIMKRPMVSITSVEYTNPVADPEARLREILHAMFPAPAVVRVAAPVVKESLIAEAVKEIEDEILTPEIKAKVKKVKKKAVRKKVTKKSRNPGFGQTGA